MRGSLLLFCVSLGIASVPSSATAQVALPYTRRTLSLSGMGTTTFGDIRTVGMGGASSGLADTFIAAIGDPAGLAMTAGVGDIHYTSNDFQDGHLQTLGERRSIRSLGLALGLYPWAVSAGYLTPYSEGGTYASRGIPHEPDSIRMGIVRREFVLSAARVFFRNRLSIGVSLVLGQAQRRIDALGVAGTSRSFSSYTAGAAAGAMLQLPRRVLLGLSTSSQLHYAGDSEAGLQTLVVPGFFRPVEVPWRVSFGAGFIPNRFFRADFTLNMFTKTDHTALIRDEAATVGRRVTFQPHLGFAYVFADFKEFKATMFGGTYFEESRITGASDRFHGTAGLETRIWIITLGGGFDLASAYRSYLFSAGVDVFNILARVGIIPKYDTPASRKLFPKPWVFHDEGLARSLVKDWHDTGGGIDPIKVALAIPKSVPAGFVNAGREIKQIAKDIAATVKEIRHPGQAEEEERAHAALVAAAAEEKQREEAQRKIDDEIAESERVAYEKSALARQRHLHHRRHHVVRRPAP